MAAAAWLNGIVIISLMAAFPHCTTPTTYRLRMSSSLFKRRLFFSVVSAQASFSTINQINRSSQGRGEEECHEN